MNRLSVSSSRSIVRRNSSPRFRVDVVAQQQARAVADVLDRVREVVHEARGDAAEHRLALLALDVLLQLDEAIGHRVERVAEVRELVAGPDVHARVELAGGDGLGRALQRENRRDELAPEQVADRDHAEQRDRDRDDELPLQLGGVGVGLAGRLLDDDRPAERRDARGDAELGDAAFVHVFARHRIRREPRGAA